MLKAKINDYVHYYSKKGYGEPIVMVHGSLCDERYWKKQIDFLCNYFTVYTISLRHYWPNDFNHLNINFSIEQHAKDISSFIEEIIQIPVYLLGHSRGGAISIKVALENPNIIKKLILADPGGIYMEDSSSIRNEFRTIAYELIKKDKVEEGLQLFIDTVSGNDTWSKMVGWFKKMAYDNAKTILLQYKEEELKLNQENLSNILSPTLLIGGALSPEPYPKILDKIQQLLPNNKRVVITGSSHGMNIGNPKMFNKAVYDFLLEN